MATPRYTHVTPKGSVYSLGKTSLYGSWEASWTTHSGEEQRFPIAYGDKRELRRALDKHDPHFWNSLPIEGNE